MTSVSQTQYERFWNEIRTFIDVRLAAGERDLLALVNQIQEHSNSRISGETASDNNGETRAVDLARTQHRALSFGSDIFAPSGLFDREFPFYKILSSLITSDTETVVEFGAGYGRNLFWIDALIRHIRPDLRYVACELTNAGRDATRRLASLRPEMNIEVVTFDYRAPDYRFLRQHQKTVAFSVASIEQVTTLPARFFQGLLDVDADVTVAHYEPVGWQANQSLRNLMRAAIDSHGEGLSEEQYQEILKTLNRTDGNVPLVEENALYKLALALARGFNRNLLPMASEFQARKDIEVLFIKPDMWGGIRCPMTLLGWRRP
jgi:hypothetical protein